MGLFGPSKSELMDRIEELERDLEHERERVDDVEDRAQSADIDSANAIERIQDTEQRLDAAFDLIQTLERISEIPNVRNKNCIIETLDEPRIGWKSTQNRIVKLLIPEGATVVHPDKTSRHYIGDKKRTDKAIPLELYEVYNSTISGTQSTSKVRDVTATSTHDRGFKYNIGEVATPVDGLDKSLNTECTDGIHFWCTKQEALDWY